MSGDKNFEAFSSITASTQLPIYDGICNQSSTGILFFVRLALVRLEHRLSARRPCFALGLRLFLAFSGAIILSGCATLPTPSQVTTSLASHNYLLSGSGGPTVVLEAGLGDGKASWEKVFKQIAEVTTVFAYDRVGYAGSRSSKQERDGDAIVRELRASLAQLGLRPPYVLVGHSIGGMYMELYAREYPHEVAGLVFVDTRHIDFTTRCITQGARFCEPPAYLTALLPAAAKRELEGEEATHNSIRHAGPLPDVPTAVLTGMNKPLEGKQFQAVWLQTHRELAAATSGARHDICEQCGHYVHHDDPDLVVKTIWAIVEEVRSQSLEKKQ